MTREPDMKEETHTLAKGNFSIDIETLSTRKDAVILQIGVVRFDPYGDPEAPLDAPGITFERRLHVDSQLRRTDIDTIRWWASQQPRELFEYVSSGDGGLSQTLAELAEFLGDDPVVWAGPAHFDVAILEHAYEQCGIEKPWSHRSVRDLSTLRALVHEFFDPYELFRDEVEMLPSGTSHDALHDATWQARAIMLYREKLRGWT